VVFPESIATIPPFGPIEGQKWFFRFPANESLSRTVPEFIDPVLDVKMTIFAKTSPKRSFSIQSVPRDADLRLFWMRTVAEIIDPVFVKTSLKRLFSMTEYERFGLVFTKTRVYKFGHRCGGSFQIQGLRRTRDQLVFMSKTKSINGGYVRNSFIMLFSPETKKYRNILLPVLLSVSCIFTLYCTCTPLGPLLPPPPTPPCLVADNYYCLSTEAA
jgi:hypothetical protein